MAREVAVTSEAVAEFVAQRRLALAGASRKGGKFGNVLLKELRARGYDVVPVHPEAREIDGVHAVPSVGDAGACGGLVVCTSPADAVRLVCDASDAGIPRVWLQQGAGSDEALATARERGVSVVHGHCLLMFLPGTGALHRFHGWLWGLLGKRPAPAG